MPGVISKFLPWARAAFIVVALSTPAFAI